MQLNLGQETEFARLIGRSLRASTFTLLDLGCSGGIAPIWRCFGDRLRAIGVDPNIAECRRLAEAETLPSVEYVLTFLAAPGASPLIPARSRLPWSRIPAHRFAYQRTQEIRQAEIAKSKSAEKTRLNQWHKTDLADPSAAHTPIELLAAKGVTDLDFLKVDVDGTDFELLQTLDGRFGELGVLGLQVEVNYFGSEAAEDNTLHNVDRLLKRNRFELFDINQRRYSTRFLPGRYISGIPAEANYGRIYQGDALFVRDFAQDDWRVEAAAASPEKLAKLAAIFSIYGLPDCAAEILVTFRNRVCEVLEDVDAALDLLTVQAGFERSYSDHMASFERDEPEFYPSFPGSNSDSDRYAKDIAALLAVVSGHAPEGPYSLETALPHNAAVVSRRGSATRILTPQEPWAYALELPRDLTKPWPATIRLVARTLQGQASVGLLNTEANNFLQEIIMNAGGFQLVNLAHGTAADAGSIVVRNGARAGQSLVEITVA
jgi:hypothetical protein